MRRKIRLNSADVAEIKKAILRTRYLTDGAGGSNRRDRCGPIMIGTNCDNPANWKGDRFNKR